MPADIERALVQEEEEDAELQARRLEHIAAATHKSDATDASAEESERRKRKEEEEEAAEAKASASARLDYCWHESLWWSVWCCLSYSCLRLTSAGARGSDGIARRISRGKSRGKRRSWRRRLKRREGNRSR